MNPMLAVPMPMPTSPVPMAPTTPSPLGSAQRPSPPPPVGSDLPSSPPIPPKDLLEAAKFGNVDEIKKYVDRRKFWRKRFINKIGPMGYSALMVASKYGKLEAVKYLVDNGGTLNLPSTYGETPLYLAAEAGFLDVVRFFISKHADKNKARRDGTTPFLAALFQGHEAVAKYLMEKGASYKLPAQFTADQRQIVENFTSRLDVINIFKKSSAHAKQPKKKTQRRWWLWGKNRPSPTLPSVKVTSEKIPSETNPLPSHAFPKPFTRKNTPYLSKRPLTLKRPPLKPELVPPYYPIPVSASIKTEDPADIILNQLEEPKKRELLQCLNNVGYYSM